MPLKPKRKLPLAPLERIIRENCPDMAVSRTAVEALSSMLFALAEKLSSAAKDNALHAKRKTVKDEDFFLAYKNLLRRL